MTFPHDDPKFGQIIASLGRSVDINPGQIEKDYWIVHVTVGPAAEGRSLVEVGLPASALVAALDRHGEPHPRRRRRAGRPSPRQVYW